MPTEYRSSNTELISQAASAIEDLLVNGSGAIAAAAWAGLPAELRALAAVPAPQPHPEPIAWMVGTAFWWTKEEAERDAAATGLPIVGLGPMTGAAPAEQHQAKPVAYRWEQLGGKGYMYGDELPVGVFTPWQELYVATDAGEVDRLRSIERSYGLREALLEQVKGERDRMIARTLELADQLANQDALLHKLKETLQREYWDEYAGLDETRELIDAALAASAEPEATS